MRIRVNITLDTDAYSFASAYARAKGIALGTSISELIRRAGELREPLLSRPSSRLKRGPHGYLVMAKTGQIITPEMVRKSSEDD